MWKLKAATIIDQLNNINWQVVVVKIADLVLVKGTGPISDLIEDISRSPYSHVAGIVKENEIIEAEGFKKTDYDGADKYKGTADIYTCDALTYEQRKKIVEYVKKYVGSHYDYSMLLVECVRYWFHKVLPHKEYRNHICSTLWNDAYKSVGIYLTDIIYPSPGELANSKLLRKIGHL